MGLYVDNGGGATPPTAPGTFYVNRPGPDAASAGAEGWDSACVDTLFTNATSGQVTLTAVSTSGVTGTFDLVLATGDHITGSFDAPACPGLNNLTQTPTCR
jgi:hypothetical protein